MSDTAGAALPAVEATAPEQGSKAADAAALAALPMPVPGERGPLTRPTERPNEPITAGLSTGPGPGPRPAPARADDVVARAKGLLMASRDPRLAILIGRMEQGQRR